MSNLIYPKDAGIVSVLIVTAALLGILRICGHTSIPFQAVAHCFVGAMLMGWIIDRSCKRSLYKWLTISLSVLEVACAVYFRLIASKGA